MSYSNFAEEKIDSSLFFLNSDKVKGEELICIYKSKDEIADNLEYMAKREMCMTCNVYTENYNPRRKYRKNPKSAAEIFQN